MKLFHVSCFVLDKYIHDVTLFLADMKARDVSVVPVRNREPKSSTYSTKKPTRDWSWLVQMLEVNSKMSKQEMSAAFTAHGWNPVAIASAVKYGRLKRNAKGEYVAGPTLKNGAHE